MKIFKTIICFSLGLVILFLFSNVYAQDKPNIVLVFLDNFGWGEPGFNGGGVIRGAVGRRRPPADKLQCRSAVHPLAFRHYDGSLRNSQR
jgi:hypothetical protein